VFDALSVTGCALARPLASLLIDGLIQSTFPIGIQFRLQLLSQVKGMESTGHTAETVAQAFIRAINRQDVDRLVELMSPAHRFVDSLGTMVEGRDRMREGWTAYFCMVPDYSIAIEEYYPSDPVVIMLGVASGTYTRDGRLHPESRWQTPLAIRALVEDGLVAEWRVYADNEPIRNVMAGGK
jgi:ketosteroid isomerase-like protein